MVAAVLGKPEISGKKACGSAGTPDIQRSLIFGDFSAAPCYLNGFRRLVRNGLKAECPDTV